MEVQKLKVGDVVAWRNHPDHECIGEISWSGDATANVAISWSEPGHVPVGIAAGVSIRHIRWIC